MNNSFRKFREVPVGDTFYFASEILYPYSGMKKGRCIKLTNRRYKYIDDGMECAVGSINAEVSWSPRKTRK